MGRLTITPRMRIASIWVVWAFMAIGALGWAFFVVLKYYDVDVKKDAAAWVQAIGSIGAILAAGAVPAWQRRLEARRKETDQIQQKIADCFQLRRLIQEIKHLLAKGINSPNSFGSDVPLVETGMKDILQRLSTLEAGRSDKVLLKFTYDTRLIVLDFLGKVRPYDVCGTGHRAYFEQELNSIDANLPPYIVSLEKGVTEIGEDA